MSTKMLRLAAVGAYLLLSGTLVRAEPVGGTIRHADDLPGLCIDTITVNLKAKKVTRVRVIGDGTTRLELRVYDEFGFLVASDTLGGGDQRKVFVVPAWTGKFKVKVENVGTLANEYILILD